MECYKIDEAVIYDERAMWTLASRFIIEYRSIVNEIKNIEDNEYVYRRGICYDKGSKEYKKILSDLKINLEWLNGFLKFLLEGNEELAKYIE